MDPASLKEFRQMMSLAQSGLASALGVSVRAVEEWEAGRRPIPPLLPLALSALSIDLPPWDEPESQLRHVYLVSPDGGRWAISYAGKVLAFTDDFHTSADALARANLLARNAWLGMKSPAQVRFSEDGVEWRVQATYGARPSSF